MAGRKDMLFNIGEVDPVDMVVTPSDGVTPITITGAKFQAWNLDGTPFKYNNLDFTTPQTALLLNNTSVSVTVYFTITAATWGPGTWEYELVGTKQDGSTVEQRGQLQIRDTRGNGV